MEGPRVRHEAQGKRVRPERTRDANQNARALLRQLRIKEATIAQLESRAATQRKSLAELAKEELEARTHS